VGNHCPLPPKFAVSPSGIADRSQWFRGGGLEVTVSRRHTDLAYFLLAAMPPVRQQV
jgi:hypothetical protein